MRPNIEPTRSSLCTKVIFQLWKRKPLCRAACPVLRPKPWTSAQLLPVPPSAWRKHEFLQDAVLLRWRRVGTPVVDGREQNALHLGSLKTQDWRSQDCRRESTILKLLNILKRHFAHSNLGASHGLSSNRQATYSKIAGNSSATSTPKRLLNLSGFDHWWCQQP